jgi:isoleucyl-tRNA synthetase
MAPILSFTAEELWQVFGGKMDDCVFFHTWHEVPRPADAPALLERWGRLRELRAPVRKQLEELRVAGKVGSSLQAELDLAVNGADYELLAGLGEELKFVMLTSSARVAKAAESAVTVTPSAHPKCERCWHYRGDVDEAGLCGRCRTNLHGAGEERRHA